MISEDNKIVNLILPRSYTIPWHVEKYEGSQLLEFNGFVPSNRCSKICTITCTRTMMPFEDGKTPTDQWRPDAFPISATTRTAAGLFDSEAGVACPRCDKVCCLWWQYVATAGISQATPWPQWESGACSGPHLVQASSTSVQESNGVYQFLVGDQSKCTTTATQLHGDWFLTSFCFTIGHEMGMCLAVECISTWGPAVRDESELGRELGMKTLRALHMIISCDGCPSSQR